MTEAVQLVGAHGVATVHPVGATVLSWVPEGGAEVLWVSPTARFEEGRAIRGGIPICWPWFADAGTPAHGLVRARRWALLRQEEVDGDAWAEWGVEVDEAGWAFSLRWQVRVGRELTLRLVHEDRSGRPSTLGGALHTYLRLDPEVARVEGLGGVGHDKLTGRPWSVDGPVSLRGPFDRVVPHTGPVTVVDGPARLQVEGRNHRDVVLWNPGGASVSDLSPGDEGHFACVETAIVSEPVTLGAGGRFVLGLRLRR